jgi:ankyrin repeat protein
MPKELHQAYGGIIERIGRQSKGKVRQAMEVLKWTFLSERPLSTIELRHALSVTPRDTDFDVEDLPTESSLLNCCLGLVTIVVEDGVPTVRLVHKSLQEYFESQQETLFKNGHREIAIICFTYIGFRFAADLQGLDFNEILEYLEFLEYAVFTWGYHVKEQDLDHDDEDFAVGVLQRCFELPGFLPSDNPEVGPSNSQNHNDEDSKLYIWKYFVVKPAEPSKHWQLSWFHLETQWDSKKPLQLLFNNNIGVQNLKEVNEYGLTPFLVAVHFQNPEPVELFLQRSDIDFNAGDELGRRALHLIAGTQHNDITAARRVVELLLQRSDIDVNCQDASGNTPLHRASKFEMELLLKRPDIDVNIRNMDGETPLFRADHEVARMLLERSDTDVNSQRNDGVTPLIHAIRDGNTGFVEMIVWRPDLDPNLQNRNGATGATALHFATAMGDDDIIRHLFERIDIDVNCRTPMGITPLHIACMEGELPIFQMLLERSGIDVNPKDGKGYTPLHEACEKGYSDIVRLLLERSEIDVNPKDLLDNNAPIHTALERGHYDIAQILLEHPDTDVYCKNSKGETALSLATSLGIDFGIVDCRENKLEENLKLGESEEGSPEDEISLHSRGLDTEAIEPVILEGALEC